jgi:O-antigen/teichoic acid export membrane protein
MYLRQLRATLVRMGHALSSSEPPFKLRHEVRRFAASRTATVLLSGVLTQADRWIVGAVAGPSALATYELAWRYAVIPKFAVLAGTQYLVPDIARARRSSGAVSRTVRRTVRIVAALLGLTVPLLFLVAFFSFPLLKHGNLHTFLPLLGFLLAGHTAHALTAPGAMAVNGLGEPQREIPYLLVAVIVAIVGWTLTRHAHSALPVAASTSLAFVAGTVFFGLTRPWSRQST